ncbi:MAG: hypothetical protein MRECE_55c009 [Mycoplasmataceae bacterium CE_OT135]|nr:MAG: hypothetical protein MRECE_55c009 [Mycoplasmataceae bacterium CE_OT135]
MSGTTLIKAIIYFYSIISTFTPLSSSFFPSSCFLYSSALAFGIFSKIGFFWSIICLALIIFICPPVSLLIISFTAP